MVSKKITCDDCEWSKEITASSEEEVEKKAEQSMKGHKIHCSGGQEDEGSEEDDQDQEDQEGQGSNTGTFSFPKPSGKMLVIGAGIVLVALYVRQSDSSEQSEDQDSEDQEEDSEDLENLGKKEQPGQDFI